MDIRPIIKREGELAGNAFWRDLAELKAKREIVEYLPNQFINLRRLTANGVTVADLEDYCAVWLPGSARENTLPSLPSRERDSPMPWRRQA